MGMSWVRVDSAFASNHKVLWLLEQRGGDHALCVYVFGLGHCAAADTDGFIARAALGLFHGRVKDAELLTEAGLWVEIKGGWEVNDWREYQPSSQDAQRRSEKAKLAAAKRWGTGDGTK